MKIILACIILISLTCSSCASSKEHCDAYGNLETETDYEIT